MPASVAPINSSSSCAGTTTATRPPSSMSAVRGATPRDRSGDAVPQERGERADDRADDRRDDGGVPVAAGGDLVRGRARQDRRRLDLPRLREQLRRAELVLLHGGQAELQEQLVGRGEPAALQRLVDQRLLLLVDRD